MMRNEFNINPDLVTLNTIISAHANANDKDGAIMFLNIMKNELHLIPDEITLAIITRIFNKFNSKRRLSSKRRITDNMYFIISNFYIRIF
jgi:pentatricopeptide repeat protein